jgi:selenocysteine-specific elongation factor
MLAGVGGIDIALLVIAADEGIMPQTREHLAILDLLQIRSGLIVMTKIDLVTDPSWLELVEADIRIALQGTFLQDAPILQVSSRTKQGFPELLAALDNLLLEGLPPRPDLDRPRLPVDRVFSIPGFGTVVTGTLADGILNTGDDVEILPSGIGARIRGLQSHKKKETRGFPGTRTAVNLSGVDLEQVHRGDVITRPATYQPTRRMDVQVRLLPDISSPLIHDSEVKIFIGTSEIVARLRLLGAETMQPGDSGWLQLELKTSAVAVRGDRFILRRPSPGETIGGGIVVDPHPDGRHKRFDDAILEKLGSMAQGAPTDVLLQASLALGPATEKEVFARSRLEASSASAALQELLTAGQMLQLDEWLVASAHWLALLSSATSHLEEFHENYPLLRGMPREELKSRLKVQPRLFNLLMKKFLGDGSLVELGTLVALPDHRVSFSPAQQESVQRLLTEFSSQPFSPPLLKDCREKIGEHVLNAMLDGGQLVAVSIEVVFRKEDYDIMVDKVRHTIHEKGHITLAEVRDFFNTSRRYAQALLEHLDAIGMTVRDGDTRRLGKKQ